MGWRVMELRIKTYHVHRSYIKPLLSSVREKDPTFSGYTCNQCGPSFSRGSQNGKLRFGLILLRANLWFWTAVLVISDVDDVDEVGDDDDDDDDDAADDDDDDDDADDYG